MNEKNINNRSEQKGQRWNFKKKGLILLLFLLLFAPIIGSTSAVEVKRSRQIIKKKRNITPQAMGVVKEWSYKTGLHISCPPTVADLENDGALEVLVGSLDGWFYCLSYTGSQKWSYETGAYIYSSSAVADLDDDGTLEVLMGSNNGWFYCFNHNGSEEWSYHIGSSVESSPCVADLDGDKTLEVLVGSHDNSLYCLSHNGNKEWNYQTDSIVVSSPCVADLDDDGELEVLIGSYDHKLYCVGLTGVIPSGTHPWYCFRGSIFHTGQIDSDSDYLDDLIEINYFKTNPSNPDSDNDGLDDFQELITYQTDPKEIDSDSDGLSDGQEVNSIGSNPTDPDTDHDGLEDGTEVERNSNPLKWDNWFRLFGLYFIPLYIFLIIGIVMGIAFIIRRSKKRQQAQILVAEGQTFLEQQELPEAAERFTAALELLPGFQPTLNGQKELAQQRLYQQAEPFIQEGEAKLAAQQLEAAHAAFQEALTICPTHETAQAGLEKLAAIRRRQEEDARAERQAKAQQQLAEAETFIDKEDYAQARACLEEALHQVPELPAAQDLLARVRQQEREGIFRQVMTEVDEITVEELNERLQFDDLFALKRWLLLLPTDLPIKLSDDLVLISQETLQTGSTEETEAAIARLVASFEAFEQKVKENERE